MKTVVVRRSRVGAMPSRNCSARALISGLLGAYAALECGNYHISNIEPELAVEFTYSCRTRDVDLGHEATDDVDSHEHHAEFGELGADLGRQPPVALVQLPADTLGSRGQVAAIVVRGGNPGERVGDWLAVDQQNARVAGGRDLRHVAL